MVSTVNIKNNKIEVTRVEYNKVTTKFKVYNSYISLSDNDIEILQVNPVIQLPLNEQSESMSVFMVPSYWTLDVIENYIQTYVDMCSLEVEGVDTEHLKLNFDLSLIVIS